MVLSGIDLWDRNNHEQIILPFHPKTNRGGMTYGLSWAGYDFRIKQKVSLAPGGFVLASSFERFQIPRDLVGIVHDKSSWARRGLAVQNTVFEPGWRGFATLELSNHSQNYIEIRAGDPIAQIIFHALSSPCADGYMGKYQEQPDEPVEAILDT